MSPFDRHRDRRSDGIRVPAHCPASIVSLVTGQSFEAMCFNISVKGMALATTFIPQNNEQLEVTVHTPDLAGRRSQPLKARVEVQRCVELQSEKGCIYELGVNIIEILPY